LAVVGRELIERNLEILKIDRAILLGTHRDARRELAIGILDLALQLAQLGVVVVAKDSEEPRAHVRARFEPIDVGERLDQRVLDQIVGLSRIVRQRTRKCTKTGEELDKLGLEGACSGHDFLSSDSSRADRMSNS